MPIHTLERVILILIVAVAIAVIPALVLLPRLLSGWRVSPSAPTQPDQSIHLNYFRINTEWRKLAGGSILEADFDVINVNMFPVKDIKLSCSLSAPSGTVIETKTITLYRTFPSSSTPTPVKNVNLGFIDQQVSGVYCRADSASAAR